MKYRTKKIVLSLIILTAAQNMLQAQGTAVDATAVNRPGVPELFFNPGFYLMAFVFIIMLAAILSLTRTIRVMTLALMPEEARKALAAEKEKKEIAEQSTTSLWTKFDRELLTKAVPVEKEADVMLDHDYDGIKELDNSLPPWWVWGFYLTILWSVVYLVHYHIFNTGPSSAEEYNMDMADAQARLKERQSKMANFVSYENVVALKTPESLGAGKEIFSKNCVACHGGNLEGGVGPNLTDEYWIHGGGIKNIFKVITEGVAAKGMISWKSQLSPKQIQEVSSYIMSLEGSKPANGKEPQGDKWVEAGVTGDTSAANLQLDSTAVSTTKNN